MALIKNSQISVVEPFDMNGFRVIEVANPTTGSDAATKLYVDQQIQLSGSGDMQTSVYDPTLNGYVDSASFAISSSYLIGYDNLDNIAYTNISNVFIENQTVSSSDGSGSAIWFGDGDTGFWEETEDLLRIRVGGVNRLSFDNDNYLIIVNILSCWDLDSSKNSVTLFILDAPFRMTHGILYCLIKVIR